MSVPIVSLFNCKGGVGKTTLTYHLAYMLSELGVRVVVADLDPQYNLSSLFLTEKQLEKGVRNGQTVYDSLSEYHDDGAPIQEPHLWPINGELVLLSTDLRQLEFEERYVSAWSLAQHDNEEALKQVLGFRMLLEMAATKHKADLVLVDLAPSMSAMNRAILVSCSHLVVPLTADSLTTRTLELLGTTINRWHHEWTSINQSPCCATIGAPASRIVPIGYIIGQLHSQHSRLSASLKEAMQQIPGLFHRYILGEPLVRELLVSEDEACLGITRNYLSLIHLAHEARKPIFDLRASDGAVGAHGSYIRDIEKDFRAIASRIADRAGLIV